LCCVSVAWPNLYQFSLKARFKLPGISWKVRIYFGHKIRPVQPQYPGFDVKASIFYMKSQNFWRDSFSLGMETKCFFNCLHAMINV